MQGTRLATRERVRTVFISDAHLGCRFSRPKELLAFLHRFDCDELFIVGDFIDGWRLNRSWFWRSEYNSILLRLIEMADEGTHIRYAPGNHDEFLRAFARDFGFVEVADEFVHRTAANEQFLVLHGDRFDRVESHGAWLARLGAGAYDILTWFNQRLNDFCRSCNFRDLELSAFVKRNVKAVVEFVSDFEHRIIDYARSQGCQGVICGHIHNPTIDRRSEFTYCNIGDWVENCCAVVEQPSGELEIVGATTQAMNIDVDSDTAVLGDGSASFQISSWAGRRPGLSADCSLYN